MKTATITLSAKFTRKPEYTPSALSAKELDQVERMVKASIAEREVFSHVEKMTGEYDAPLWDIIKDRPAYEEPAEYTGDNAELAAFLNEQKARRAAEAQFTPYADEIELLKSNADARRYFKMCWNYMIAIAWRKGEFLEPRNPTNRTWAMASGYCG